jgi:hypothetical protein
MWIPRIALDRPYTFVVLGALIDAGAAGQARNLFRLAAASSTLRP